MLRLLITGANGQVGWNLQRTLCPLGEILAIDIDQVDLTDLEAVGKCVRDFQPDIVVNAAAYTAVDKAESEPELAYAINVAAPRKIAEEAKRFGALMIHYSTDYVYDGMKAEPYIEIDVTNPLSVYGETKLAGDDAIIRSGVAYIILRTTWVYDIRGKNFLRTIIRLAKEKEELRIVGDQFGAPTWAGFAKAILEDYNELLDWPAETGEFGGELKAKRVVEINTEDYPAPAKRPRNSVLSNGAIHHEFSVAMSDWRDQLRLAMQDAIR